MRLIRTDLDVSQHLSGDPGAYGNEPLDVGMAKTKRSYQDVLPSANFSLDMTDSLKLRLAYSKNMMPLDLSTWGGGLQLNYSLSETPTRPDLPRRQWHLVGQPGPQPLAFQELRCFA